MKNSIKLTALFLLAGVSVFAATPSFAKAAVAPAIDAITFSTLPSQMGIDVKMDKSLAEKAIVTIADQAGNVIRKDALTSGKGLEKAYVLNQLENGDYTIKVASNSETVTKHIHVYDEDGAKQFIVAE
jgi:hypothetical protein